MSVLPQNRLRPKVLGTLEDLSQALDDLAAPTVPPQRVVPIAEEHLWPDLAAARPRYQFTNWAQRLREGPPASPPARRTPLERWPLVFGLGALLWLGFTGVMVAAWHLNQPQFIETALLPPPGVEEVQGGPTVRPDAAEEMAAAVEDLQADPTRTKPSGRAPHLLKAPVVWQPQNECLGTSVKFVDGAAEAALQAKANRKLMLLLNVSGDFDDSRFT